jgi:hypothetical protein
LIGFMAKPKSSFGIVADPLRFCPAEPEGL